jgi:iron complex outermembrane recepter protein
MKQRCESHLRPLTAKLLVLACSALALGQVAQAEETLEEVVVTATKRADPISKVPISVTALTQEAMDAQGVRNIQDIVAQTPGVDIDRSPGSGAGMIISVRGISSNAGAATTGVYIDDTPIQARNNAINFAGTSFPEVFDLERVEVLRGPQGTLFGAGAEGGVIRFLSVQPSLTHYTGYSRAEVSATDHGTPSGELGVAYGGPIIKDVLGFRVSAWDRHDGGYVDRQSWESPSAESKPDWSNTKVLRAALAYAPTSNLKITPAIQFQEQYTHTPSSYWGQISDPSRTELVSGLQLDQPSDDSSTVASLKIEADLGAVAFTSVSSYFHRNNISVADVSNTDTASVLGVDYVFPVSPDGSLYTVTSHSHTKQQVLTQEFRLQNSDADAKLKWLGGLFFSQAKEQDTLLQPALQFPAVLQQATGISFTDFFGAPLTDGIYEYTGDERSNDQQIAVFGNVDWRFADHWTLNAGLRFSETKIDYSVAEGGPEGPIPGEVKVTTGVQKDHPVTPRLGVNWEPDDHNMVYASVAKGYRIGGVNDYVPSYCGSYTSISQPTYKSDTTVSYEVGAKSRPAGGRLQIDASIFHIDWKDIQQYIVFPCLYGYTANSGGATSNGFDLSVNVQAAPGLIVGASVGYTKAKYTTTTLAPGSGLIVTADGQTLGGNHGISPWTLFGYAEYSFHIPGGTAAYARIQEKYNSQSHGPFAFQNPNNINYDPFRPLDQSVSLLDLRTGLLFGKLDVSLFVNNVLNRSPRLYTSHQVFTDPNTGAAVGSPLYTSFTERPRTAGLTAVFRF